MAQLMLTTRHSMKRIIYATFAAISAATALAGGIAPPIDQVPDAGASIILLTLGVATLGLVRKFRR